tara:strand:+ start:278 stop:511 length:234 start_codon:yes stop_codon:yes gene_type:complete
MDTISLISGVIGGGVVGMIVMYVGLSTTNKSKQDSILKIAKEKGESIKKEKIQTEMTYPGQVKITVIREKRAIAFAK